MIAVRLRFTTDQKGQEVLTLCSEVGRLLYGLINSLESKKNG